MELNELGGVIARYNDDLKRAKEVDLITLPEDIQGTNCFNCKFIKEKKNNVGYCAHKKVAQYVSKRQCCIEWQRTGEYRQFSGRSSKL